MPRTINLRIFKNEQFVESRSFLQDMIKIGKLRSSDLYLDDESVARMHAVLEVSAGELRLVDLGSATGTTLNGERVRKSATIRVGDSLLFGPFRLELESESEPRRSSMASAVSKAPRSVSGAAVAPALGTARGQSLSPHVPRVAMATNTDAVESNDRYVAQVIARYGDTVVDAQHVGQVRARRRQAPTWMALGGLMLLAGAGMLAHEAAQDWEGYRAARAKAATAGRAAPESPGTGLGGWGVGLALLGLVPFGFGLNRRGDRGLERYTLGEGPEASFSVLAEGLPDRDHFPLVESDGDSFVLRFTAAMKGHARVGGSSIELEPLVESGHAGQIGSCFAYPLPEGASAHIEHAGIVYEIASVPRGRAVARSNATDRSFWAYNAASFVGLGSLLALVHLVPESALSMSMDELRAENRYVGYLHQPQLPSPEEAVVVTSDPSNEDKSGGEGQRHAGVEGKAGNPRSETKAGLYSMRGPRNAIPQMARDFDPQMSARNVGILGVMQEQSGHFLASPYGGAFAVGRDDDDIWGGLTGIDVAEAFGVGGVGLVGTGRGGGGQGQGTIGLGNVGTIGKGGFGGEHGGYGRDSGTGFRARGRKGPKIYRGRANVRGGSIDKDIIRRIVRNHHNEVRHCYNQGLSRDPNLAGRVAIMFTIGPTGRVPSAAVAETTLKDRNVANCVAQSVRRWTFPKPESGGRAMVTYPFTFSPG